tara:strand:+ start:2223 stop:2834 length:612 start_codon:yes stop_codon:yes gene_type:complete
MKKTLLILLFIPLVCFGQNITFLDGKTLPIKDVADNWSVKLGFNPLSSDPFAKNPFSKEVINCLFQEISKKKTYESYSQDLRAAAGIIDIEDRLSFYFAKDYVMKAASNCTNNDSFSEAAEANYGNKEISESRIKTLAEIFLSSWKTELGLKKFNEMGELLNWIGFSECYVRKTLTSSTKSKNRDELISRYQDECMAKHWKNK